MWRERGDAGGVAGRAVRGRRVHRTRGVPLLLCGLALTALPGPPAEAQSRDCRRERARMQEEILSTFPPRVASLRDEVAREGSALHGYELSHGDVVLAGMGVALVQFADPGRPELLFYRPDEAPASEWLDFEGEDGPYELVGWGYLPATYAEAPEPPSWTCVPREAWFVHEAGFHLLDGDMHLTPGSRSEAPDPPTALDGKILYWHPAGWDIHFWVRDGVPEIGLVDPEAGKGGLSLPPEAFWHPAAPE